MIRFNSGSASDVGRVRRTNQDHALMSDELFAVADGMGGHRGGEVASEVAVSVLGETAALNSLDELVESIHRTNDRVVERAQDDPALRGMGTTVTVLAAIRTPQGPRLGIANVGDSRLYLRGTDGLVQLTEDHSLVEALVRDGRLSREEAATHPQRNILTRALGIDEKVLVDAWELLPVTGDRYVICSDGLFNEVSRDDITALLREHDDAESAARALVDAANEAGGRDNVTVVIVDVADAPPVDEPPADRVVAIRKAVPDAVLRVDPPAAGDEILPPADPHPDEIMVDRAGTPVRFVTWRLGVFVAAVMMVLAVLLTSIVVYARSSYHVSVDGEQVVIFKGRENGLLWFDPTVEEPVELRVSDLADADLADVLDGREFDSLEEARKYADELRLRAESTDDTEGAGPEVVDGEAPDDESAPDTAP